MRQYVKHCYALFRKLAHQELYCVNGNVDAAVGDMLIRVVLRLKPVSSALGWCAEIDPVNRDSPVSPLDLMAWFKEGSHV